ncbi:MULTISPECIES: DUF2626 domain-containing protein [Salimicrobium]|uniref:DUF2626 domain-containing protein n=4 Tax=Salimicrobium TaxID=351195 RepID=K2FMZ5_9BACI|nr:MULTISPECIES: DUF2626 domain-containing protein [Salimicrobium]AKG04311.1 hypothetical protein AAV35_005615 [Salimicrobium jeotgali]EKE32286.1 hypothetical protein MJ3_04919 [Salimicrobium jeotgali]MBM7695899.1 hypothetical protein [Salimicrobium jeotgali]PBB04703.1 DUF2626 domain-containing protein [Salimicrobium humidisoli]SDX69168.1 Protein of unknown function [Salimicrobium album]
MDRMFRTLAFWTGIFAVMFYAGDMMEATLISLAQTAFFLAIGFLKLSERMYIYIFFSYLTVFMIGFTYYTSFILQPGFGH